MRSPALRRSADVSPRVRFAARLALVVEVICIAWLASFGQLQQMQVQSILMFDDKSTHALAFFVTGLTAWLASRSPAASAFALTAMAGGVEVLQLFVPGRAASIMDFTASLVGVAFGMGLGAVLWPRLFDRRGSD